MIAAAVAFQRGVSRTTEGGVPVNAERRPPSFVGGGTPEALRRMGMEAGKCTA
jgi:hypothetical protein